MGNALTIGLAQTDISGSTGNYVAGDNTHMSDIKHLKVGDQSNGLKGSDLS